jgi:hypothetical protein
MYAGGRSRGTSATCDLGYFGEAADSVCVSNA